MIQLIYFVKVAPGVQLSHCVIVCHCVLFFFVFFTKVCNRPFAEKLSHGTKTPRWKANDVVGIRKTKRLHHSEN